MLALQLDRMGSANRTITLSKPPSAYKGWIVQWDRDPKAQKTAWLVGSDLKRRWIPDIATYQCLKARGVPGPVALPAGTLNALSDLTGVRATCGNPQPPPPSPTGIRVVNADGGVYWRGNPPNWNAPIVRTGYGVYTNDRVTLTCWTTGSTVPPLNNNTLWYQATVISGRGIGSGFVNDHFLDTGINQPNVVVPGVPRCGGSAPVWTRVTVTPDSTINPAVPSGFGVVWEYSDADGCGGMKAREQGITPDGRYFEFITNYLGACAGQNGRYVVFLPCERPGSGYRVLTLIDPTGLQSAPYRIDFVCP